MTETDKPERRFQFSLKTLLIAVLILSLPLSWLAVEMDRTRRQKAAVKAIERLGGVTDDWVGLRELFEFPPPVVQVDLHGPGVTDAALVHVCNLHYLEYLDLSGTEVTDTAVLSLTEMPHLESVCLEDTHVTPEGVKKLQEALPNCNIEY